MRRIQQISVKNLFGMFNHTIPLNLADRITIIHGPNGFGKTAILKLLNELSNHNNLIQTLNQQNGALRTTPFDKLRIDFDDNSVLEVTKSFKSNTKDERQPIYPKVLFQCISADGDKQSFTVSPKTIVSEHIIFEGIIPKSAQYEFDQVAEKTRELSSEQLKVLETWVKSRSGEKEPDWLRETRQAVSVHFIETQRLLNLIRERPRNKQTIVPTVQAYSEELTEIIKTKLAESTALSQSLDRTFPARLVNPTRQQKNTTEEELRRKLMQLEQRRSRLMAAGLLDQDSNDQIQIQDSSHIDHNTKVVLSVYVDDAEKKLGIFDELANKIDLLQSIINKHFLYKEITISRTNGFVFTNSKGTILSPTDLSSGEQHELVLFYELLFKVAPGSLILIDEPELSLHVAWQMEFLKDLQKVTQLADLDIVIATHSPQIVHDRWDLTVQLEGPRNERVSE